MLRKLARGVFLLVVGIALVGAVLYALGLRLFLDGGGDVHFAFTKSADARAAEIEKHREAQSEETPHAAAVTPSSYWTSFRGPDRDGHYRQQSVRMDWGRTLTPLWKQPVGGGYASFVIACARAFKIEKPGARELAAA